MNDNISLTPPSEDEDTTLTLQSPDEAVESVQLTQEELEARKREEQHLLIAPKPDAEALIKIGEEAAAWTSSMREYNPNSPEFSTKLNEIHTLAAKEVEASGDGMTSMLERKSTSAAGAAKSGNTAQEKISKSLTDLRQIATTLTPHGTHLSPVRKVLGFLPFGGKVEQYFQRYETAEEQIRIINDSLLAGQDELRRDNAALKEERTVVWNNMQELNKYIAFTEQLDKEVSGEIDKLEAEGNYHDARVLKTDMLFPIRQRRQDLVTSMAVSVQGYMTMEMTRTTNVELINNVTRARTTTMNALRTAVATAEALGSQKKVINAIQGLNSTTNEVILATSKMLAQQVTETHKLSTSSGVEVKTLETAFNDLFSTLDSIENFKVEANQKFDDTIAGLTQQLERAKPQLERAKALADAQDGNSGQFRLEGNGSGPLGIGNSR